MGDTNLTAVLYKPLDMRLEDRTMPEPGPGEVRIAIKAVGICGSDIHIWSEGILGEFELKGALVPGHEPSGVIHKLGPGVKTLKIGDRVAIEPGVPCHTCDYCKSGSYNHCRTKIFKSVPPFDGFLQRFHCHPADCCYKLPDHVSFDEGTLLDPLAVLVHACLRGGMSVGHRVLVCGSGTIGLCALLTAKAYGASSVCVTDISKSRLELATSMGADHVVHVDTKDSHVLADKVKAAMGGMVDICFECSGAESSIQAGIYATKNKGKYLQVGLGEREVSFPIVNACMREVDVIGNVAYVANDYNIALELIASGKINTKPFFTHHFPLEKVVDAFETSRTAVGGAIKVIIDCSKNE